MALLHEVAKEQGSRHPSRHPRPPHAASYADRLISHRDGKLSAAPGRRAGHWSGAAA